MTEAATTEETSATCTPDGRRSTLSDAPPAISIEQVTKIYPVALTRLRQFFGKSVNAVQALTEVSFDVREGEVFGLIGRNGAGKTTLTKIVATLVQPTEGAVRVRGFDSVADEEL